MLDTDNRSCTGKITLFQTVASKLKLSIVMSIILKRGNFQIWNWRYVRHANL